MRKSELRNFLLYNRLSNPEVNNIINNKLLSLINELQPNIIAAYIPIKHEVDILPTIKHCWQQGKKIYMPSVIGKEQPLIFKLWTPESNMIRGAYNTLEPDTKDIIQVNDIDVMLVPSLGILLQKSSIYRIGYGGGFYDRTLENVKKQLLNLKTIGIYHTDLVFYTNNNDIEKYNIKHNFIFEKCDIRTEIHDIPLDKLITPKNIL